MEREGKEEVEGEGAANCFAKNVWAGAMLLFENIDIYPVTANVKNSIMAIICEKARVIGHVAINEKHLWLPSVTCHMLDSRLSPNSLWDEGNQPIEANLVILLCASVSTENCHNLLTSPVRNKLSLSEHCCPVSRGLGAVWDGGRNRVHA